MRPFDTDGFETAHLNDEYNLPSVSESTFPHIYIRLNVDLFSRGDGMVIDRHHESADRYERDDQRNQIGGLISADTLSSWLQHGCERVHQIAVASSCHPDQSITKDMLRAVYDHNLEVNQQKRACLEDGNGDTSCFVSDLMLEGTWRLTLRDLRPEYVALLNEAIDYLNVHRDAYEMALGEQLKFGGRIVNAQVINPLYNPGEIQRIFARSKDATPGMFAKDDIWREQVRQQCVQALQERMAWTQQRSKISE